MRPGDVVAPNQPVARVLRADDLWVKAFVPEIELGKVRLNQKVEVTCDAYPGQAFPGRSLPDRLGQRIHAAQRAKLRRTPPPGVRHPHSRRRSARRVPVGHGGGRMAANRVKPTE